MANLKRKKRRIRLKSKKRFVLTIIFTLTIIISAIASKIYYENSSLSKVKTVQASALDKNSKLLQKKFSAVEVLTAGNKNSNKTVQASSSNTDTRNNTEASGNTETSSNIHISNNSFDAGEIQDYISKGVKINAGEKIAFLTFDDGPSNTVTPKILNILKSNNINATFFIIGKQIENNPEAKKILLDEYREGNAIGNHTYSHNYQRLYPNRIVNTNNFMSDIEKNNDILKSVLGDDFNTRIIRFPGGHMSWKGTEGIDNILGEKGYKYIDWNVLTGDSEGKPKTKEELINRYNQTINGKDNVVILMHDTSAMQNTADVLQNIITDLKNKGYEFKTLN